MNPETVNRAIARLIALCQPHHTYTVFQQAFNLSSGENRLGVGTQNNLQHHARMVRGAACRTQKTCKGFFRNRFRQFIHSVGNIIFLQFHFHIDRQNNLIHVIMFKHRETSLGLGCGDFNFSRRFPYFPV